MRPILLLALITIPALAQATSNVSVLCSVRIRALASADYDPASEYTLQGFVTEIQPSILKVRLPFGVIRVHVGSPFGPGAALLGQRVKIVASKCQDEHGQRFIAREVRHAGGTIILRDAKGIPMGTQL